MDPALPLLPQYQRGDVYALIAQFLAQEGADATAAHVLAVADALGVQPTNLMTLTKAQLSSHLNGAMHQILLRQPFMQHALDQGSGTPALPDVAPLPAVGMARQPSHGGTGTAYGTLGLDPGGGPRGHPYGVGLQALSAATPFQPMSPVPDLPAPSPELAAPPDLPRLPSLPQPPRQPSTDAEAGQLHDRQPSSRPREPGAPGGSDAAAANLNQFTPFDLPSPDAFPQLHALPEQRGSASAHSRLRHNPSGSGMGVGERAGSGGAGGNGSNGLVPGAADGVMLPMSSFAVSGPHDVAPGGAGSSGGCTSPVHTTPHSGPMMRAVATSPNLSMIGLVGSLSPTPEHSGHHHHTALGHRPPRDTALTSRLSHGAPTVSLGAAAMQHRQQQQQQQQQMGSGGDEAFQSMPSGRIQDIDFAMHLSHDLGQAAEDLALGMGPGAGSLRRQEAEAAAAALGLGFLQDVDAQREFNVPQLTDTPLPPEAGDPLAGCSPQEQPQQKDLTILDLINGSDDDLEEEIEEELAVGAAAGLPHGFIHGDGDGDGDGGLQQEGSRGSGQALHLMPQLGTEDTALGGATRQADLIASAAADILTPGLDYSTSPMDAPPTQGAQGPEAVEPCVRPQRGSSDAAGASDAGGHERGRPSGQGRREGSPARGSRRSPPDNWPRSAAADRGQRTRSPPHGRAVNHGRGRGGGSAAHAHQREREAEREWARRRERERERARLPERRSDYREAVQTPRLVTDSAREKERDSSRRVSGREASDYDPARPRDGPTTGPSRSHSTDRRETGLSGVGSSLRPAREQRRGTPQGPSVSPHATMDATPHSSPRPPRPAASPDRYALQRSRLAPDVADRAPNGGGGKRLRPREQDGNCRPEPGSAGKRARSEEGARGTPLRGSDRAADSGRSPPRGQQGSRTSGPSRHHPDHRRPASREGERNSGGSLTAGRSDRQPDTRDSRGREARPEPGRHSPPRHHPEPHNARPRPAAAQPTAQDRALDPGHSAHGSGTSKGRAPDPGRRTGGSDGGSGDQVGSHSSGGGRGSPGRRSSSAATARQVPDPREQRPPGREDRLGGARPERTDSDMRHDARHGRERGHDDGGRHDDREPRRGEASGRSRLAR